MLVEATNREKGSSFSGSSRPRCRAGWGIGWDEVLGVRVGPGEGLGGWVEVVGVDTLKSRDSRRHGHRVATGGRIRVRASLAVFPRTAPLPADPAQGAADGR